MNNFWNEANSKIKKYKSIRNDVNNNSSIKIKAESFDFEYNSDQLELNHISLLTVLEEVVEPNHNDNKVKELQSKTIETIESGILQYRSHSIIVVSHPVL